MSEQSIWEHCNLSADVLKNVEKLTFTSGIGSESGGRNSSPIKENQMMSTDTAQIGIRFRHSKTFSY